MRINIFSDDKILYANRIDLVESMVLPYSNKFYRHVDQRKGGPVDFIMFMSGVLFADAFEFLVSHKSFKKSKKVLSDKT